MEIIGYCYNKNIRSVIMAVPNAEESNGFTKCVRKFARTKLRLISYYDSTLAQKFWPSEDSLTRNLRMMKPIMPLDE